MKTKEDAEQHRKVVVVGAGSVGATYCYALAQSGLASEIVLIDRNKDLVKGQVLDLVHGQPFFPPVIIRPGTESDYAGAQLVVITAGAAQKPGESRLQLLKKNAEIVGGIAETVTKQDCKGVMLIVSNPVDVLTYVALKRSGWERGRVIGSGTVLDSARFRHLIGKHCDVDVHNVHAYFLGEHGDSEFAAWSMTHIAGIPVSEYCKVCGKCPGWKEEREDIEQQVRDSAAHIINSKGSTYFAVGLALVKITGSILRNQNSILTVSTYLNGEYGIKDVCLSVPCVVSHNGIGKIIDTPLASGEQVSLMHSADILRKAIDSLK
ncbi:MAG: L-lactate dehydrogenase [Bacteroidetes bacterium GWE2_41_25]|nr:MAG: L-lactate dehydrogenase [Bacteroidetes bacterium GWA2_40_15]OFX84141.1 MAG: L-lactate dehydrogenase [Bacteroidetes bacterium GWC2_40_22]OFX99150.1 MAG: L-lactate dehydrogenase [Bacteroidetes bacterium GWE2_41_25]OFY56682.1 MAG: L-lactate dehydrogenase [Bacteroidetes bacterium GWF2_41_9]HBH84400.1 L-lactate dehydrogenase [Bacteroidales bacterium]